MAEELYTPDQLDQLHQQLWHCVLQFANISATQERTRIARDLHDSLGHALTALNFQLQTAMKLCQPNATEAQGVLTEAHRLVAIATQEMRDSVRVLRDDAIDTQAFEVLIESLIQDFYHTTQVRPSFENKTQLPEYLKIPIYRIVQESLNNIRKYAQATTVQIQIEATSTQVSLTIQDNGRGFDQSTIVNGYGLKGMQERVALLQGTLEVKTQLGEGCCITARIPMQLLPTIEIGDWQPLNLDNW
ncbi:MULTISPECIES: sensor histidine kinase [Leptolyngbya]|uniref:sensor histidine kinase n=1 Tax=Leptolyngbya TaxID=47251 RepID=UPI001682145F|nr:sensor histidine kinase [Leptolyngbya sp. FACHB-1624]MBD1858017.1 sensor histidine kinase [Leptolyngbya sp. FACHB-1624]